MKQPGGASDPYLSFMVGDDRIPAIRRYTAVHAIRRDSILVQTADLLSTAEPDLAARVYINTVNGGILTRKLRRRSEVINASGSSADEQSSRAAYINVTGKIGGYGRPSHNLDGPADIYWLEAICLAER